MISSAIIIEAEIFGQGGSDEKLQGFGSLRRLGRYGGGG